jgi:3-dehydroquinate dehydratase
MMNSIGHTANPVEFLDAIMAVELLVTEKNSCDIHKCEEIRHHSYAWKTVMRVACDPEAHGSCAVWAMAGLLEEWA